MASASHESGQPLPASPVEMGAFLLSIAAVLAVLLLSLPIREQFHSHPQPSTGYAESVLSIEKQISNEQQNDRINPECVSRLFHHNGPSEKVIVIFHGFTNCPKQFEPLGMQLQEQGYTVYIPRMRYHGLAYRSNRALQQLSASQVVAETDAAIDQAQGLGEHVIVMGLSSGGVMAAWATEQREDLYGSVIMAPILAPHGVPRVLHRPIAKLARIMPPWYVWWDSEKKMDLPGPQYAYPGFPIRGIGAYLYLGQAVLQEARENPPKIDRIAVIRNENDQAVSPAQTEYLITKWNEWNDRPVITHTFAKELGLNHDIIDPNQPEANTEAVYPEIIRIVGEL